MFGRFGMSKKDKEEKNVVDAASSPRQAEKPVSEEKRGEDAASTESPKADVPPTSQTSQTSKPEPAEPDWKTLYAITLADFDNYKKRAARDREDVYRYAESDILKDILPTVDNLDLALQNAKDDDSEFVKGVKMVYDGLLKSLADHGAKPMADLVGTELDPNLHEAIATMPNAEVGEGRISTVVKTGWTLGDKLLRAAQVVVSAGSPA